MSRFPAVVVSFHWLYFADIYIVFVYECNFSLFPSSYDCRCPFTSRTSCRSVTDANIYMETIVVPVICFRRPSTPRRQRLPGSDHALTLPLQFPVPFSHWVITKWLIQTWFLWEISLFSALCQQRMILSNCLEDRYLISLSTLTMSWSFFDENIIRKIEWRIYFYVSLELIIYTFIKYRYV